MKGSPNSLSIPVKDFVQMQKHVENICDLLRSVSSSYNEIKEIQSLKDASSELSKIMKQYGSRPDPQPAPQKPLTHSFPPVARNASAPCTNLSPVSHGEKPAQLKTKPGRKLQTMRSMPRPPLSQTPTVARKTPPKDSKSSWQMGTRNNQKPELRRSLSAANNPRVLSAKSQPAPPNRPSKPPPIASEFPLKPSPTVPSKPSAPNLGGASPLLSNFSSKSLPKPPASPQGSPHPRQSRAHPPVPGRNTRKSDSNITESVSCYKPFFLS